MRNAVTLFSLFVAIAAEAPYHLPRPAPNAPIINYPRPCGRPAGCSASQQGSQFVQQGASQSQYNSNGYSYPAPAPQPIIVSQPQQVYQPIARPAPQPLPVFPQPAPQLRPLQPQPLPIISQPSQSYGVPQFQQIRPLPALISQPQQIAPQPQPVFQQPIAQPQFIAPQPQPIVFQPQQIAPQPLPVFQRQPISPPSTSYGIPQLAQPIPAVISQPQLQIQAQPQPAPIQYQPQQLSSGYSYEQAAPLQLQNSALSSYQADSNQYNNLHQAQVHRDALDDVVVSRVQDIIKDNEHSSARNAGYLSLVSGVSLENAKPSVEVLSFVQNSPLSSASQSQQLSSISQSSLSSSSSSSLLSVSRPSLDYGVPSSNNFQSSGSLSSSSFDFLPQAKPAPVYGVPNK